MSSSPQETETHDVDLSREQRWIVHHVLVDRADRAIDDGERPPEWLVDLLERIEAGEETITDRQARELEDALDAYAEAGETPPTDVEVATAVVNELAAIDR